VWGCKNGPKSTVSVVHKATPQALPTLFGQSQKGNSPKFTVASDRSDAAVSTRQQHGGTPLASKRSDLVAVVAPLCIKELRLVTMQLPEKFLACRTGTRPNFAFTEFYEVRVAPAQHL
jgi:hypothetical protein